MTMRAGNKFVLACSVLALTGQLANAEPLIALQTDGSTIVQTLVRFDSATPGITSSVNVTGLTPFDRLLGIDRRPSDGLLYGIAQNVQNNVGRVYAIDEATGAATLRSTLFADPTDTTPPFPYMNLGNVGFSGVDFNPTADRLRLVSDGGFNLRINVDSGAVQQDVTDAYPVGDPSNPFTVPFGGTIAAVAYSNNFAGATATVLTGVDVGGSPRNIVTFTDPNAGVIITGFDLPPFSDGLSIGYDISGLSGLGYLVFADSFGAALFVAGQNAVTRVGTIGSGAFVFTGLAGPVGPIPEPSSIVLMALGLATLFAATRRKRHAPFGPSIGFQGARCPTS